MLDTTEIGIFTALGVAFAAGLLFLALWGKQNPLRVSAYALIAVAFLYVGFAFRSLDPNSWVAVEMTGVAIFGSLAYMSIIFSPWSCFITTVRAPCSRRGHSRWPTPVSTWRWRFTPFMRSCNAPRPRRGPASRKTTAKPEEATRNERSRGV